MRENGNPELGRKPQPCPGTPLGRPHDLLMTCVILGVCDVVDKGCNAPVIAFTGRPDRYQRAGVHGHSSRDGSRFGEAEPPAKVTPLRPSIGNPDDTQQVGEATPPTPGNP